VGRYLLQDCENVSLSYNPEFIAQGQIIEGLLAPDIVRRRTTIRARTHKPSASLVDRRGSWFMDAT